MIGFSTIAPKHQQAMQQQLTNILSDKSVSIKEHCLITRPVMVLYHLLAFSQRTDCSPLANRNIPKNTQIFMKMK